jgi:hypothetical protein
MSELERINDKIFKKIFKNAKNAGDFLKKALPREIKERLDFSTIEIDPTNYVSDEFKEGYSDVVIKAEMKSKADRKISTDIYFIMEHKTEEKTKFLDYRDVKSCHFLAKNFLSPQIAQRSRRKNSIRPGWGQARTCPL